MFAVELQACGDLAGFLRRPLRGASPVRHMLRGKTAVKDVIEACGIPHPEVDLIVVLDGEGGAGGSLDFAFRLAAPARLAVYPVPAPPDVLPAAPRLQARGCRRFIADGHLGALVRHLRLAGIDTAYERDADDGRLLEIMSREDRALLTRDRRLLMHSIVRHGYCPRSDDPEEQAREVLRRFTPEQGPGDPGPLGRCLRCNGLLREASRQEVVAPLAGEPRTLRFYDEFFRCSDCGKIYWRGSHFGKLAARLSRIRSQRTR
jgi:uncharacterized protein with PIN domain